MTRFLLQRAMQDRAQKSPDSIAVVDGDRTVTYGELDQRSDQLAALLRKLGVQPGDRVGLYLEKSAEAVVGIYGVLKSGAAYVPLDPRAPVARVGYITRDCRIRLLLTGKERASRWGSLSDAGTSVTTYVALNAYDPDAVSAPPGATVVGFDALGHLGDRPVRSIAGHGTSLDLAYILYTSGSTGDPKGVMLSHRNALTFVDWAAEEFELIDTDRVSSHAPFHFDLSVFDLFATAQAGATLVLVPSKVGHAAGGGQPLHQTIRDHGVVFRPVDSFHDGTGGNSSGSERGPSARSAFRRRGFPDQIPLRAHASSAWCPVLQSLRSY